MTGVNVRRPIGALLLGALVAAACATVPAATPIKKVTVSELARNLVRESASLRGSELRVCGGRLLHYEEGEFGGWPLTAVGDPHRHGAVVLVRTCRNIRPATDPNGCLNGRVARADGSLLDPAPGESILVTDAIESYVWFLHQSCLPSDAHGE
jgi:hypothetical protein